MCGGVTEGLWSRSFSNDDVHIKDSSQESSDRSEDVYS